jgi:glycosyltransferase involved in cell wall biosynthesis
LYPRKNLVNQLLAFDRFKEATGSDLRFVLIGSRYKESEPIIDTWNGLKYKNDVIFTGRVEPREKADRILAASEFMLYVSRFEGFGIPLLEAIRCGVPAITGNVTAMPEIGGDSVLAVDPENVDAIADAIQQLATDSNLRAQLIGNGKKILPEYTWEKTAQALWECLIQN